MEREYHILYRTTCTITGRFYVGCHSTDSIEDGYLGSGNFLKHSVNKYGAENHKREILQRLAKAKMSKIEKDSWKKKVSSAKIGSILSEATKKKMGLSRIGNKNGSGNKGNSHSEETKKKISLAHIGSNNGGFSPWNKGKTFKNKNHE